MARHATALALLALLAAGVYSNALDGPFVFDDRRNITDNPAIRVDRLDAASLWRAAVESPEQRPVASLSFALNYWWGGYEVRGYHVVNVAIHLLNGWVAYAVGLALLRRRTRRLSEPRAEERAVWLGALLAAAVFVAHPVQTQAVTYVVQRMASLSAGLTLAAFGLFVLGRERAGAVRVAAWLGALACWGLALGSKEIAITLPLAALLYEGVFHPEVRTGWWRRRGPLVGAIGLVFALAALVFLRDAPLLDYSRRDFDLGERLLTQLRVVVRYGGLLLWPHPSRLNLDHTVATSHGLLDPPTTLLSGLALLAVLAGAWRLERVERLVSFAVVWLFLHLALESSVFPLEMMFEHRLYLPSFGFALLVASALLELARARRARLAAALGGLYVALLGAGAHQRNEVWRDEGALWADVLSKSPESPRAINNVAMVHLREGRVERARALLRQGVEGDPHYAEIHYNLGNLLRERDPDEAIARYRRALEIAPRFGEARVNLAYTLRGQGRADEALFHYQRAWEQMPGSPVVMEGLAWVLATHPDPAGRRPDLAIPLAEGALRATGGRVAKTFDALGAAYAAAGRFEEAVRAAERAVALAERDGSSEVGAMRRRLAAYREGRPYRMSPYIERR